MISSAFVAGGAAAALAAFARCFAAPFGAFVFFFSGAGPLSVGGWVLIVSCSPSGLQFGDKPCDPDIAESNSVASLLILIKDRQGVLADVLENSLELGGSIHFALEAHGHAAAREPDAIRERPERAVEARRRDLEDVLRKARLERIENGRGLARGGLAVVQRDAAGPVDEERQRGAAPALIPVRVT